MKTVIKPDIRYFDEGIQRVIETHSPAQVRVEIHKAISAEREACAKLLESRKTGANELMDAVRDMEAKAIRARGDK